IDESVIGWKEYEMEVVRDKADNVIIVCSIENIDPMGVHTGDSITVAPALTLTDKEYQVMRNAAIDVIREIGVDTGGSNVQFAVNSETGRMLVIEMNPRVSRSSALASKATGFPIASIAAKLAVGYLLDEVMNDCTETTPASFEPTIDYIVTKIPRFTFEKFSSSNSALSSSMKSVGETMAIGRNFAESLQKALRSLDTGLTGLNSLHFAEDDSDIILRKLSLTSPERILIIAEAFRRNITLERIYEITKYDRWYLDQIQNIVRMEEDVVSNGIPESAYEMMKLKEMGFSDERLAELTGLTIARIGQIRHDLGIKPVYKRVDTCAAEFDSVTPYMYSCYTGDGLNPAECESNPTDKKKIIILGSGPNRIGQGVEFDYACCHAAYALREVGYETIMINCNPETVSTDYDTADRLYFEPITAEDVLAVIEAESKCGELVGVNLQFGGQTPLKIAKALAKAGVKIIGTSTDAIDLAEDRERFKQLLDKLSLKQPDNFTCYSIDEALEKARSLDFPVVVRPSYVLGGRSMEIIHNTTELGKYLNDNQKAFLLGPILIDKFLRDAIEVDVDAIADGVDVYIAGVMEHVEEAGIHSGDSSCSLPPYSLSDIIITEIRLQTKILAKALQVVGLMNVQFAIQGSDIYILEVNPRASRTVPFVAKTTGVPIAKIAARVMAGEKLLDFGLGFNVIQKFNYVAVKEAVFPFARFTDADVILGPEMRSTGEVMGIDSSFDRAFAKAHIAKGDKMPTKGTIFISVQDRDKKHIGAIAASFIELGFAIVATRGTAIFLKDLGIEVKLINKVLEGNPHIVDLMKEGKVDFVINTTEDKKAIADSFSIRRTALISGIPCITTISGTKALLQAIKRIKLEPQLEVRSVQSYLEK
ncbi:MAG: Carbamoyl-phosphate synthase large chain, partial [Pseudomonadota bacterium]